MQWLMRRWFLVGLAVLIPAGLTVGALLPEERLRNIETVAEASGTSWLVAAILFLMSFSLDSRQIGRSLKNPGPVLLACGISFGFLPLLALPLMKIQLLPDFSIGLMIAASVPCTMAAASVWTRKAGGNDAVSLLVTMLTNGLCFIVTPLWLNVASSSHVAFDLVDMMQRLLVSALLPATIGQLARLNPSLRTYASRHKSAIGVLAQAFILVIVFTAAAFKMGPQLSKLSEAGAGLAGLLVVWISCVVVHLLGMALGWEAGRWLDFDRADRVAVAFSGSQKTLPIGLLVATDPSMFGDGSVPFALFPMLMYHASQLFLDTAVADRLRQSAPDGPAAATGGA